MDLQRVVCNAGGGGGSNDDVVGAGGAPHGGGGGAGGSGWSGTGECPAIGGSGKAYGREGCWDIFAHGGRTADVDRGGRRILREDGANHPAAVEVVAGGRGEGGPGGAVGGDEAAVGVAAETTHGGGVGGAIGTEGYPER